MQSTQRLSQPPILERISEKSCHLSQVRVLYPSTYEKRVQFAPSEPLHNPLLLYSALYSCTSPYPCTALSQWARVNGYKLQEHPGLAALQDMCNLCASCIRQTSTPVPRRFRQAALSFRQICDSVYPSGTMNVNSPFAVATLTCPSLGSKVQVPPPLSLWLHSPPPVSPFIFT